MPQVIFQQLGKLCVSILLAAAITGGSAAHAQTIDLNSGLEVYWTFDEGTGNSAGDSSGNARAAGIFDHAQFADSQVLWTEGKFGGAIDFDGSYFLGAPNYFGIGGSASRTISLWIRTEYAPSGANVIVGWGPNVAQQRWHFKLEAVNNGALRTENQGGNNFAQVPVNDGQWHHIVSVLPEGGTTIGDVLHYVDGQLDPVKEGSLANPVDTMIDPSVAPPVTVGGSPFNAGFRYVTATLDDVRIYSRALTSDEIAALARGEGVLSGAPPSIVLGDAIAGAAFYEFAKGITATVSAIGTATLDRTKLSVTLNGEDVTSRTSVTGAGTQLTVQFKELEPNKIYSAAIKATDSNGKLAAREFSFSTFREETLVIEAEHYNFAGGQFFDNPTFCNTLGSAPNCYFDRLSIPGVDAFDSRGASDDSPSLDSIYRYSSGVPDREEEYDTFVSADALRRKFADAAGDQGSIRDYDVNVLNAGDWANYTRTFPQDGAFTIYLRARAGAAQQVLLEEVLSAPSAPDQTTRVLGYFHVKGSPDYTFVPLTDLSGANELTVALSGQKTIRLSTPEANNNINLNYFLFVPSTRTAILPTITLDAPLPGAVLASHSDVAVRATAADVDGVVARVTFFAEIAGQKSVIGEDTAGPFEIVWAKVPPGTYSLSAEATDNDGLAALSSSVVVVVDSEPPEIVSVQGSPGLNAIEIIFDETLDAATAQVTGNYSVEPSVAVTSVSVQGRRVVLNTANQTQGTEYSVTVKSVKDAHGNAIREETATFKASAVNLLYGLELYWPFDDGSGGVARDVSGFGRNAVVYDVPAFAGKTIQWTEGRFGGGIHFDAAYFLAVPDYFGISGAEPRTISMWFKSDWRVPSGATALLGWGRNSAQQRWHFKLESSINGALRTENQGGNNFGSIPVNDGQWHHVVCVFPEGGQIVGDVDHYIDGVLDPEKDGGTGNPVDTNIDPAVAAPVTVGGAPLGVGGELRYVNAVLDDVRLYRRALSSEEIAALARGEQVLDSGMSSRPKIEIRISANGQITLTWGAEGVLQTATSATGPWTDLPNASSPFTTLPSGLAFYRIAVR